VEICSEFLSNNNFILWEDRFKYIEKHKYDFKTEDEFYKHIALIPDIIENPDYVGKHPSKNSIEYIKRIDEIMIVAVRIKDTGNLAFRSAYPLTEKQLSDYISCKTVIRVPESRVKLTSSNKSSIIEIE
jgi:hypothetical protein